MSKSLGNFFTVRDLLEQGIPGEVIRFVLLSTHYRSPMDWTSSKVKEAKGTLYKWREYLTGAKPTEPHPDFISALGQDLNTSKAIYELGVLFLRWMNTKSYQDTDATIKAESVFLGSAQLLGLLSPELGDWFVGDYDFSWHEDRFLVLRDEAMDTKDFTALDEMKKALTEAGVKVSMSKEGVKLEAGPDFDSGKIVDLT